MKIFKINKSLRRFPEGGKEVKDEKT